MPSLQFWFASGHTKYSASALFVLFLFVASFASPAASFGELKGWHLRGCALIEAPYVFRNEKRRSGVTGVALDYFGLLQENLQFTYDVDLWNGTRQEFIDHMASCDPKGTGDKRCLCDIGIGAFVVTHERVHKVRFVWPFGHENYHMVSRKSDLRVHESVSWFVFKTFSGRVWLVILAGICMHAIGTVFFGPFRPPEDKPQARNRTSKLWWHIRRFPAAVLYAYSHLIGNPFAEQDRGTPSFHKTAWLILGLTCGMFLVTVYQASLTVLLFETTRTSSFKQLSDLTDCSISPDRVARTAMIEASGSQDFWNFMVNTTMHREQCGWEKAGITVTSLEEGFQFLREGKAGFFFDLEASILFRAHLSCDLFEPVGEPFFSTSVAFVLPNKTGDEGRDLQESLDHETMILRETGGFKSAAAVASENACDPAIDATITLGKLWAFFALYGSAWSVLLVYRCIFLRNRKPRFSREPPKEWDFNSSREVEVIDLHTITTKDICEDSGGRESSGSSGVT